MGSKRMAISGRDTQNYGTCFAPRVGLWLSRQWPFRKTKFHRDITLGYTVGISGFHQIQLGNWRLFIVYLWTGVSSGVMTWAAWLLVPNPSINPLVILGALWTTFNFLNFMAHCSSFPANAKWYKKAWRIWLWGRGFEYTSAVFAIVLTAIAFLAENSFSNGT